MEGHRRDAGLVRAVGPWDLAASIVNCVVGASIFVAPAVLAGNIGTLAPLAFLVGAFVVGAVAICFAEAGSRVPTSGGAYGYVEAAFGPLAGFIAGLLLWFSNVLACGGIAAAFADMMVRTLPPPLMAPVRVVVIVGAIGALALVNIGGVARATWLINATTLLKLIPLAVFVVLGAGAIHSANLVATAAPSMEGVGRALILILFALSGMEISLCASGEVVRPARTIPRALAIAMLSVALLYATIQLIAQGILGAALAHSNAPLADAMARVAPGLQLLMVIGAAVSMFGILGSEILCSPRILYGLARDGLLPRMLGRLHTKHHSPHIAILCHSALAIGLALTGTFAELAVLSGLAIAPLYIAGCAAAWMLARRQVALAGEPLNFRWLVPAAAIGIASMLTLIALASRVQILGLLAILGASALAYVLQTRTALARH